MIEGPVHRLCADALLGRVKVASFRMHVSRPTLKIRHRRGIHGLSVSDAAAVGKLSIIDYLPSPPLLKAVSTAGPLFSPGVRRRALTVPTSLSPLSIGAARISRLLALCRKDAAGLERVIARLFSRPMIIEQLATLDTDDSLAERVEAFAARFRRLQDTLSDKLLPAYSTSWKNHRARWWRCSTARNGLGSFHPPTRSSPRANCATDWYTNTSRTGPNWPTISTLRGWRARC